jgi:hypothetical protein
MHTAEPNGHQLMHDALAGPGILLRGRLDDPGDAVCVLWYLLAEELEFALADALFSDGEEGVEDAALRS